MFDFDVERRLADTRNAGWMVTLVDLISLLLSFFVLVFAGSALPVPAWEATSRSLRTAFGGITGPAQPMAPAPPDVLPLAGDASSTAYLAAVIAAALGNDPAIAGDEHHVRGVVIDALGDSLVIALSRERVFYPQSGQITAEAAAVLGAIVPHLSRLDLPAIVAVETRGGDAERSLAFDRGRAMLAGLRARGAAPAAPVYIITERAGDARRQGQPCTAAAVLGQGRAAVVCLAGDGQ